MAFRAIFAERRKKYMDAMVPLDTAEYMLEAIKRGQKFYLTGQKYRQSKFDERTIEFFRRESQKVILFFPSKFPLFYKK